MTKMDALFTPIKIGKKTASNRLVIMPWNAAIGRKRQSIRGDISALYQSLQRRCRLIDLEAITVIYENRGQDNELNIMPHNEKPLANFVLL